jgi:hypothetical protein
MPMIPLDKTTFPARESDFEFEYTRPSKRAKERKVLGTQSPRARKPKKTGGKSRTRRGAISPVGVTGRPAGQAPQGRTRTRQEIPGPTPPDISVDLTKLGPSPEVDRKQAISSALLKSAAFVQPSSISGSLQGLLSGLGIGTEIDAAMQQYRDQKKAAAESVRANKLASGPAQRPPMRPNYGYSMGETM